MPIDLRKITRGREKRPIKCVTYSMPGLGKTHFACSAPDTFVLDTDKGSHPYDVAQRAVPESWTEAREWLAAVEGGSIKCATVVIDSTTQLEAMAMEELFQGEAISAWGGGYGRGDDHLMMNFRVLMAQIERIWRSGKNVVMTAHATVKNYDDPMVVGGYDRFQMSLREKIAGSVSQWCDYVLFAREDVIMQSVKGGTARATSTGQRSIYTKRTPAYDAKARGISGFPERLPLSWDAFAAAILDEESRTEALSTELSAALAELGDDKLTKSVREWLKEHPTGLVDTHNRIMARVKDKRDAATAPQKVEEAK